MFGQIFPDIGDEPISGINFRITALDAVGTTLATMQL